MPLNPSDNPVFSEQLPKLDENSTSHADTWNQVHQPLLDNDVFLRRSFLDLSESLGGRMTDMDSRVAGIESSSAVSVQSAVALDWLYRGNNVRFEMFANGYTLIDMAALAVIQGVNGDDSVDVTSTENLRAGDFYVLSDKAAQVSALVQVKTILSGSRIRLAANLTRDWGATATLSRCSFDVQAASKALALPGDIYLSRSINIGTDQSGGAVVIRRTLNSGLARLYYRDGYQPDWKECGWSTRRTADVPAGLADYEYILPMRGDGWLRLSVEGEGMTIAHIVALGQATGLGGFINPEQRPNTPVTTSPVNAAVNVMERPALALASYSTPAGNAQAAVQFQLATSAAFAVVQHDSGALAAGLSYTPAAGVLAAGTMYYWRGRVQDVAGLWSEWSTVSSFSTAASFVYVAPPTITGPVANSTDVPEQPTVTLSAFSVIGGADTHRSSQVQIRSAEGTYAAPVHDSGADTVNKLSQVVPAGKLKAGLSYYMRARQEGTNRGFGEWGPEIKITTKAQFANIIGLALLSQGGGAGSWARVDEVGAAKVTDASFFSSHAIYGAIQEQVIDGQSMIRVPAFYVKRGVILSGPNSGKKAIWVSDQPAAGFTLHPAFKSAEQNISQFWVGKYQATVEGTKLGSKAGATSAIQMNADVLKTRAENRNVSGITGFSIWSIYQLSAIQTLALVEFGGPDVQALIAPGNVSGGQMEVVDGPLNAKASWRGLTGLWGNAYQLVDGLKTSSTSEILIWDRNGNKGFVSTGQFAPSYGYTVTMSDASGVGYDLQDVFVGSATDSNKANGTYGDDTNIRPNAIAYHGGSVNSTTAAGLFALTVFFESNFSASDITSRLAKI
ncbi:hypothetical protein NJC40_08775 [Pseudomonas sp. 21LCFQ02]|uniref:glycoside hydrolase family 78 protein n=1 Tax=Pseudomonas sp. 21LCFQ02 TaxID=2957505 RepID=UPI00209BA24C|nr:hypothetical protein [Pseudomonas sp. 21LCFQ02]MCO8167871.1 hypothetical protein [Pseudomonas sp. 21LCFQ02]